MAGQPNNQQGRTPVVILQQPKPKRRVRWWPIAVLAGAVSVWVLGTAGLESAWRSFLMLMNVHNPAAFGRLCIAGLAVVAIVAVAKAARG